MFAADLPPKLWLPPKPAIIRSARLEKGGTRKATFPFPFFAAGRAPATISNTDSPVSSADATAYTFSAASIGTAAADRIVIVGVGGESSGTLRTLSSVTIGGSGAAEQVNMTLNSGSNSTIAAIYSLLVTSGTTADIVVTFSGGMVRAGIVVWAAFGLSNAAATNTNSASAAVSTSSLGAALTVQTGGIAVGYTKNNIDGGGTIGDVTWDNLTEDVDEIVEAVSTKHNGASQANGSSDTKTVNFAATTPNRVALVLAAFR